VPSPELMDAPGLDRLWRDGLQQISDVAVLGSDERVIARVAARRRRRQHRGIGATITLIAVVLVGALAAVPDSSPDKLDVRDDASRPDPTIPLDLDKSVPTTLAPRRPSASPNGEPSLARNPGRSTSENGASTPGASTNPPADGPAPIGPTPAPTAPVTPSPPVTQPPPPVPPDVTAIYAMLDDSGLTISPIVEAGPSVRVEFVDRRTDKSGKTPLLSLSPTTNKVYAGQTGSFDLRVLRTYETEVTTGRSTVPDTQRVLTVVEPRLAAPSEAADVVTVAFHADGHVSFPHRELRYGNPELQQGHPADQIRPWTAVAPQARITLRILNPDGIMLTLRPRNARDTAIELRPDVAEASGIVSLEPTEEHSYIMRCGRPSPATCEDFVLWTTLN